MIAGQSTTCGRPLNRLDPLVPGDVVELGTPVAIHTSMRYRRPRACRPVWVVPPTDLSVVSPDGGARILTLAICPPKGTARQWPIMRFELTGTEMPVPRT